MIKRIIFLFCVALLTGIFSTAAAQKVVSVKINAGTTSTTLNGSTRGARYVDYAVSAFEGQTMSVRLTKKSGTDVYFNVLRQGSEVAIADDAREVMKWSGTVDSTDVYVIRVYLPKSARLANRTSTFRLTIKINHQNDPNAGKRVIYNCESSTLTADFKEGTPPVVRLRFGTQDIELPLEPSASGSKYEFNNQMFWVKGREATLQSKVLDATCKQTN